MKTADWIINQSRLAYLKLAIDLPWQQMLSEAKNLKNRFVPHRDYDNESYGWYSLCLHGLSSSHTHSHTAYGILDYRLAPYQWTDISTLCPITTAFFKNNFGFYRFWRLRFMLLKAGGWIAPHIDSSTSRLWAINIALSNPDGCAFYMQDHGIVPFHPGTAFLLDTSNRHWLENKSTEDRYHIIVHGERNHKFWKEMVENSYRAYLDG
jgi:Aspartyl/Asparaginyl beta-hydroxylase